MENIKKACYLSVTLMAIGLMNSCGFPDMKGMTERANKITSVMQNNCDCEEVSILEYSTHNLTTTASYKLVGCEFKEFENEAARVKELLTDSIANFCEIDHFNLVFVNKGERQVKSYSNCKEE